MKIDPAILVTVTAPLLAEMDVRTAQRVPSDDLAWQCVGALRTFVDGWHETEAGIQGPSRCERCHALLTADEAEQWEAEGVEYYRNCSACNTSQF